MSPQKCALLKNFALSSKIIEETLRVNAKILERNPVSQPRDNLNLYYDGRNYL